MSKRRKKRFRAQLAKSLQSKKNFSENVTKPKNDSIKTKTEKNPTNLFDIKKDLRLIIIAGLICLGVFLAVWIIDTQTLHIENLSKTIVGVLNIGK